MNNEEIEDIDGIAEEESEIQKENVQDPNQDFFHQQESTDKQDSSATSSVKFPFVWQEWMYAAVEAMIFASHDPLTPMRIRECLALELACMEGFQEREEPSTLDVKDACFELLRRWSDPERMVGNGFRLVEAESGYTFRTVGAQARFVRRMQAGKPQKLSRAALETLSVIAYRQPTTKPHIEEIRGVDSSNALKILLDKKLVKVLGKADDIGRPLLYGTTKYFLDFFGLQHLNELPTLKELHELEHGSQPELIPDEQPAQVMDLFADTEHAWMSQEAYQEGEDAISLLEKALKTAQKATNQSSAAILNMRDNEGNANQDGMQQEKELKEEDKN
jgi:segregation and condensation protein B